MRVCVCVCVAVVVSRQREASIQSGMNIQYMGRNLGVTTHACVGGSSIKPNKDALIAGTQVVLGTPGRLCDLLARVALGRVTWDTSKVSMVVLDRFTDAKDVAVWSDHLTVLLARFRAAQLCIVADNREVIDALSLLSARKMNHINFCRSPVPCLPSSPPIRDK